MRTGFVSGTEKRDCASSGGKSGTKSRSPSDAIDRQCAPGEQGAPSLRVDSSGTHALSISAACASNFNHIGTTSVGFFREMRSRRWRGVPTHAFCKKFRNREYVTTVVNGDRRCSDSSGLETPVWRESPAKINVSLRLLGRELARYSPQVAAQHS